MQKNGKFWRIELAVLIGLLVCVLVSVFAEQRGLAKGLIRLHISAASDTAEDQAVKLAVRDRLLTDFFDAFSVPTSAEEAQRLLSASLPTLTALAQDELAKQGRADLSVSAALETEIFPVRHYDNFSLPAGEYTTLRLKLGGGRGANWWCVMFPPLCAPTALAKTTAKSLSPAQMRLVQGKTGGVRVKFKVLEWFYAIQSHFR